MDQRFEALKKLFENAEVAQKLLSCTAEEAATILKEQYQLEFSVEELDDVAQGIRAALTENESNELSGEQLDEVVGGAKGSAAYNTGYSIGKVVQFGGTALGIVGGLVALGVVSW